MPDTVDVDGLPQLAKDDTDEWVQYLQQLLEHLGYSPGGADGRFGAKTEQALMSFQQAMGFEPTGITDTQTWSMLIGLSETNAAAQQSQAVVAQQATTAIDESSQTSGDTGSSDDWLRLKEGAAHIANARLNKLHDLLQDTVGQFTQDAELQIEALDGPSADDMGLGLFKALSDCAMLLFPVETIAMKFAAHAIKTVRDTFITEVTSAAASSAASREAEAKLEMRRILNDLLAANRDAAIAAWNVAESQVPESLDVFFDENPQYRNLPFDESATQTEEWICDSIGIWDADVAYPGTEVLEQLWTAFHEDLYRLSAQMRWEDRSVWSKAQFLDEMDPSQVPEFLRMMGEDPDD